MTAPRQRKAAGPLVCAMVIGCIIASCDRDQKQEAPGPVGSTVINIPDNNGSTPDSTALTSLPKQALVLRNFSQYRGLLSSLTGVDQDNRDVSREYALVRNQLPSSSEPAGFTAFHQIAMVRLAFAYCDSYVEADDALARMEGRPLIDTLIDRFFAVPTTSIAGFDEMHASLEELVDLPGLVAGDNSGRLARVVCTAILSSHHFTFF